MIIVATGYTYSVPGVTQNIQYFEQANLTGTSNGAFTISVAFWNGTSETSFVNDATTNAQIRINVAGYNTSFVGANQIIYLTKRI